MGSNPAAPTNSPRALVIRSVVLIRACGHVFVVNHRVLALADLAVFDRDLTSVEPDELLEARCDLTIRGGEIVFERAG